MKNEAVDGLQQTFLSLVRSGLLGEPCTLTEEVDWNGIHALGVKQGLLCVVYEAIKKSEITIPRDYVRLFQAAAMKALRRTYLQKTETTRIFEALENRGIDYLPLKGVAIRPLYPREEFRWMEDADIHIRSEQYGAVSEIMQELGYRFIAATDHELTWEKPGVLHVEFHRAIVDPNYETQFRFFENAFREERRCGQRHEFRLDDTDMLAYVIAHLSRDYMIDGGALRNLIDLYILEQKGSIDQNALKAALEQLGLLRFYTIARDAARDWLGGKKADACGEMLLERLVNKGDSFVRERHFALRAARTGSRRNEESFWSRSGYIARSVFRPYRVMERIYPVLRKAPILLPFFWVRRGIEAILFRRDRLKEYVTAPHADRAKAVEDFREEMALMGLEAELAKGSHE